jgi:hypothetical protein
MANRTVTERIIDVFPEGAIDGWDVQRFLSGEKDVLLVTRGLVGVLINMGYLGTGPKVTLTWSSIGQTDLGMAEEFSDDLHDMLMAAKAVDRILREIDE